MQYNFPLMTTIRNFENSQNTILGQSIAFCEIQKFSRLAEQAEQQIIFSC